MLWEYKFVGIDDTTRVEDFNLLGEDEWELVCIYQSGGIQGIDINHNDIQQLPIHVIDNQVAMFKRPKRN